MKNMLKYTKFIKIIKETLKKKLKNNFKKLIKLLKNYKIKKII